VRIALGVALVATLAPARAVAQPQSAPAATAAPTSAPVPDTLTVDELLARLKTANGADRKPENEHEAWTLRAYGLDGTVDTWHRGTDMRTDMTLGPFRTLRGVDRAQRWHQNENGETILDRPEPSQVEKPATQTIARTHDPVDAWELITTYASGHITRNYYDPKTLLLVRSDRTIAGHDSHMIFDDFRTDARGRTRSWHYTGGDDRPGNDYEYRLIRDDIDPTYAADFFSVPKDRRMLVEFPAGTDIVRLPARVVNNRIYVRLDIGGRGLDFLLDSGASLISIDTPVARQLGLGVVGRSAQTVAGTFATGRVVVPSVAIGPLAMHDVVMHTIPLDQPEKNVRVVGLLGFDFFDAVGLRIDYENGTVDAYRPGTITAPASALPLDVILNSGAPVVHATLGDSGGDDFVIDTGAAFPYVLFQRFLRAHPTAAIPSGERQSRFLIGVGGNIDYHSVSTRRLEFGGYAFDDPEGIEALSPSAFGFDNEDGLIGADILKLFTIYTDYASGKLFLAPGGGFDAAGGRIARASK
jgi:hypothetical protein